jgi:hypothetical protein
MENGESWASVPSAGRDARLYGRQDAFRYADAPLRAQIMEGNLHRPHYSIKRQRQKNEVVAPGCQRQSRPPGHL